MPKKRYQIHVLLHLDIPNQRFIYDEIKRRQEHGETMADIVRGALMRSFENGNEDGEVLSILKRIEDKLDHGVVTKAPETDEDRRIKKNLLESLERMI